MVPLSFMLLQKLFSYEVSFLIELFEMGFCKNYFVIHKMCYFQSNVIYITFYDFDEIVLFDNKKNEIKILENKTTIDWWSV